MPVYKMPNHSSVVLISGAGELGSRYLQGLVGCEFPLDIFVHDVSQFSLDRAAIRWMESRGHLSSHQVFFISNLNSLPKNVTVAIIATTSDIRSYVVKSISTITEVKYWILEKVLAQNEGQLLEILAVIGCGSNAWVNTPRRSSLWFKKIKQYLDDTKPVHLKVFGCSWGLACNAIHFLDLVAWISGNELEEIKTQHLNTAWIPAKRPGYWEVDGDLFATFSDGSTAHLSCQQGEYGFELEIRNGSYAWVIKEELGLALRSDSLLLEGRLLMQSEATASLLKNLIHDGKCELPSLVSSIKLHQILISTLLEHWNFTGNNSATNVPIT